VPVDVREVIYRGALKLVIFDSVVSRPSLIINCEKNYDPVDYLPSSCKGLTVQANGEDRFYRSGHLNALMSAAESCGGEAILQEGLAHPFEGNDNVAERMDVIEELVRSHR
jgi:hypothetical protein